MKKYLQKGFTMVELILTMGVFAILAGIATLNLVNVQQKQSLNATIDIFIADLKEQQLKAMVGDTEGSGTISDYGIRFNTLQYTMFRNTYGTSNFIITLPPTIQISSTTFPNSEIIFLKGSGEVLGLSSGTYSIFLTDITNNEQKEIEINRYGVVTEIN